MTLTEEFKEFIKNHIPDSLSSREKRIRFKEKTKHITDPKDLEEIKKLINLDQEKAKCQTMIQPVQKSSSDSSTATESTKLSPTSSQMP